MLENLTTETFAARRGETFRLTPVPGTSGPPESEDFELDLTLAAVRGNGLRGPAGREQFSLHFEGPGEPLLPQQIYRLANEAMGELDLFLVPIARDAERATYEAVFT